MIFVSSIVPVLDNSGGLLVKCIKIYGKAQEKVQLQVHYAYFCSTYRTHRKVKKGQLFKSILARVKHNVMRHGGYFVRCEYSGVVY